MKAEKSQKTLVEISQRITSEATSLNQLAGVFKKASFKPGSLNLDYGGGRFDRATEWLAQQGVSNWIFDPFNRSADHNLKARWMVVKNEGADSVTVSNVLNVIEEKQALCEVIRQAANALKNEGSAHFYIYEGDRSGVGKETSKGWQRNEKASGYMEAIHQYFEKVERSGSWIKATGPQKTPQSLFEREAVMEETRQLAKSLGVPMPSAKHGVGKLIGGCLYAHRSAWDVIPEAALKKALAAAPGDFQPVIAKWDIKEGSISLIESEGFDREEEPAIQRALKVSADGSIKWTPEKEDPQIYHHKWSFARHDYAGFDWILSCLRSCQWFKLDGVDKSRIGTRSYWEKHVTGPLLGESPTPPANNRLSIKP